MVCLFQVTWRFHHERKLASFETHELSGEFSYDETLTPVQLVSEGPSFPFLLLTYQLFLSLTFMLITSSHISKHI